MREALLLRAWWERSRFYDLDSATLIRQITVYPGLPLIIPRGQARPAWPGWPVCLSLFVCNCVLHPSLSVYVASGLPCCLSPCLDKHASIIVSVSLSIGVCVCVCPWVKWPLGFPLCRPHAPLHSPHLGPSFLTHLAALPWLPMWFSLVWLFVLHRRITFV